MTSDPVLRRAYNRWNKQWFNSELPEEVELWWEPVAGGMAEVIPERTGHRSGLFESGGWFITIDPAARYDRCRWGMDLLHEMVHLKVGLKAGHGKKFHTEMVRLAMAGAFIPLW